MTHVHLSLGSNVGDRRAMLRAAVDALDAADGVRVCKASSMYETAPVGGVPQPEFLNMAVEVETALAPLELLAAVKGIERKLGRVPSERWGPRAIDIDIVLWEDAVLDEPDLTVPHREFRRRAFVLAPLAEIAPDAVDPVTGATVSALAASDEARGAVERVS